MRTVVIREHGGLEALRLEERPVPEPAPGEVRVRVRAVGLNHLDLWVRRGVLGYKFPLPIVPGCDVAGEIDRLGPGVAGIATGGRVVVAPGRSCGHCKACRSGNDQLCREYGIRGETFDGGCCEYVTARVGELFPIPPGLDFPEAAALPLAFLTAWHMLTARAGLKAGERVLVHAAGSGVSSAAIQIARMLGAKVMATARGAAKCERARQIGADECVDTTTEDFVAESRRWTGKRGVDVIVDHVGAETFDRSIRCLVKGGRYVTCGATSGYEMKTDFRYVYFKSLSILGSTMGANHELEEVLGHVADGRLRPVVDRTLPLERVAEAHELLETRAVFGKVVLIV